MEENWVNKTVNLTFKKNNFILRGIIKEQTDYGVVFKTDQKTSYICWDAIKSLTVVD